MQQREVLRLTGRLESLISEGQSTTALSLRDWFELWLMLRRPSRYFHLTVLISVTLSIVGFVNGFWIVVRPVGDALSAACLRELFLALGSFAGVIIVTLIGTESLLKEPASD
ncbi:MAG: hypothetical protein JSS66_02405 [Armatimonadetes bacterium]|nr:hypothetical protein [Armatimonadota bacterium]